VEFCWGRSSLAVLEGDRLGGLDPGEDGVLLQPLQAAYKEWMTSGPIRNIIHSGMDGGVVEIIKNDY
jgi:hypothetical protein